MMPLRRWKRRLGSALLTLALWSIALPLWGIAWCLSWAFGGSFELTVEPTETPEDPADTAPRTPGQP